MLKSFRGSIKDTHFEGLWKVRQFAAEKHPFSCSGELPVLIGNPEPPKNPSLLPQNRFKCLRRIFVPPRQKLALYGALKWKVKILWILPPRKRPWNFALNAVFPLFSLRMRDFSWICRRKRYCNEWARSITRQQESAVACNFSVEL